MYCRVKTFNGPIFVTCPRPNTVWYNVHAMAWQRTKYLINTQSFLDEPVNMFNTWMVRIYIWHFPSHLFKIWVDFNQNWSSFVSISPLWALWWRNTVITYICNDAFKALQLMSPIRKLPRQQSSRGQHGAHLGPVGLRCAPDWPHEPCYQNGSLYIYVYVYVFIYVIYVWVPHVRPHCFCGLVDAQ